MSCDDEAPKNILPLDICTNVHQKIEADQVINQYNTHFR